MRYEIRAFKPSEGVVALTLDAADEAERAAGAPVSDGGPRAKAP